MRFVGFAVATVLAVVLVGLWALETLIRGATCGPAEGGGSCAGGLLSVVLVGGASTAIAAAVALAVAVLRRG
jgi:hypothetical protein